MKAVKNIIWDWNGTLLNDGPLVCSVINYMLERRNMKTISYAQYQALYRHPIIGMYEEMGFDFEKEPYEELTVEWHEKYEADLDTVGLQDDSKEILEKLSQRGISQSILSALPHHILIKSVADHDVEKYFVKISGLSDFLARSKIDNGHKLMAELDADPEETVMIGDTTHDVETAEALGIRCMLVSRGFESAEKLARHGVPVFRDFSEILDNLL